jgi:spermidine synthase
LKPRAARVRVQESRHGRELIVDETFASLYRPGEASTGSVWDAIGAPLLLRAAPRRARLLMLGMGGGSVCRQLRRLAPEAEIVAVEFDPEVVAVARAEFDLDELGLEVVVDDALAVLRREQRSFDAIFEDVFIGRGDDVHKPDWIPDPGHALARRRLKAGGVLVSNTLDEAPRVTRAMRAAFAHVVQVGIEGFDNRVLVASDSGFDARSLRAAVAAEPLYTDALPALSFRTLA